jgi:hypothetical protein
MFACHKWDVFQCSEKVSKIINFSKHFGKAQKSQIPSGGKNNKNHISKFCLKNARIWDFVPQFIRLLPPDCHLLVYYGLY